jgi:hypothetical protein
VKVEVSGSTYRGYWIFGIKGFSIVCFNKETGVVNLEMNLKNKPSLLVFGRLGMRKATPV